MFEMFRKHVQGDATITAAVPHLHQGTKKFSQLNTAVLTEPDVWAWYGGWLVETYKIEQGKHEGEPLQVRTALQYLSNTINEAKRALEARGPLGNAAK